MPILCKQSSIYSGIIDRDLDILKRVAGLSASAGYVVFPYKNDIPKGAVFVDGRYTLEASLNVDHEKFDVQSLDIEKWIKENVKTTEMIFIDPKYFSIKESRELKKKLPEYAFSEIDLYEYFGIHPAQKKVEIYEVSPPKSFDCDGYLFADPCLISWLLGIRNLQNQYTCAVLGYLLVDHNEMTLYVDDDVEISHCRIKKLSELKNDIRKTTGADFDHVASCFENTNLVDMKSPLNPSIKTDEEIKQIKIAAKLDSVAILKFLYWFYTTNEKICEAKVISKIEEYRKESPLYICNSFETIAAIDDRSAMIHYSCDLQSENSQKEMQKILLLDSGGQYKNGTTDITRTISRIPADRYICEVYTNVLKGHIALASAVVPLTATGAQLDGIARQFLWNNHMDYDHGTGHGIGYLLNVHEGRFAISRNCSLPIKSNMLISNEPGYYEAGNFGVRLENMMISKLDHGFISFDTISLIPFDDNLIADDLLTENEKLWLQKYNARICDLCDEFDLGYIADLLCRKK